MYMRAILDLSFLADLLFSAAFSSLGDLSASQIFASLRTTGQELDKLCFSSRH